MIHEDTEVLFPPRVIPALENLRGETWRELVLRVKNRPIRDPERVAFILMMTRLCGCVNCHADSFRAMRGCTQCSTQAIRRFRDSDQDLLAEYVAAREDIQQKFNQR